MSQNRLLTLSGWAGSTSSTPAYKYDNDTGIWSAIASEPESIGSFAGNAVRAHKGGWDGNRWYTISATGGLYAYTPVSDSWVGPLVSGSAIIPATAYTRQWCMTSDGAYIYILADSNDLRRYDPSIDQLASLAAPPGTDYNSTMFMTYDGSGNIYGCRGGDTTSLIGKYSIASDTWTTLPSGGWSSQLQGGPFAGSWPAFLQGAFWLIFMDQGNVFRSYRYDPVGNTWTTKSTLSSISSITAHSPGGENTDTTVLIWKNFSNGGYIYNIVSDAWIGAGIPPVDFNEGTNFVITRVFSPAFIWYQADGTTQLPITVDLGSAVLSQTLTFHAKVKTPVGRAAGVTVSVPVNISTDAATVVGIAPVVSGPFTTSFSTGALNPGNEFDVFVRLTISASQTLGLSKRFFLEVSSN